MTTVNVVQLETASDIAERRNDVLSQYKVSPCIIPYVVKTVASIIS